MGLGTENLITQVRHLLDGRIIIPSIQRGYVWKKSQVPYLLDSLYKDYPVGSLLVWKTTLEIPLKKAAVIQEEQDQLHPSVLLDGQQRLTSLAAVIAPGRATGTHLDVRFNVDTEEFLNASATQRQNPRLLRVSQLMGEAPQFGQLLAMAGIEHSDPSYDDYYERARAVHRIREKQVPVMTIDSNDYEEVAEIFTRVNQGGRRLSKGDLVLSAIAARWPEGLEVIDRFNDELDRQMFSLDREAVLRLTGLLAGTGAHSIKLINKAITGNALELRWRETETALGYAVDFLKGECSIPRSAVLTSPNVVVIPAYLLFLRSGSLTPEESTVLKRWVYTAMAFSYYSNQVEGKLDADAKSIRTAAASTRDTVSVLGDLIRRASGARPIGTPVDPDELSSKKMSSAWFNLLYIAALQRSAKDWKSNQALVSAPMTSGSRIEYHHVFPKAKVLGTYGADMTNCIANLAFINGTSNRSISAKDPAIYLPQIAVERLREQQVPGDPALWAIDRFPEFLETRQIELAHVLNELLSLAPTAPRSADSQQTHPLESELPDDDDAAFDVENSLPGIDPSPAPSPLTIRPAGQTLVTRRVNSPAGSRRPNGAIASHVLEVLSRFPPGTEFRLSEVAAMESSNYQANEISTGAIDQGVRNGTIPGVEFVPGVRPKRVRRLVRQ
ncbi:GmrSD restriction endonuclease domain-containing protein [Gordonia sp. DT30]|uniref:GmrSD restriction endonuclease domain-containing protein n=1 Tax=Gordonia sp. DT30 TaxID=3416546 RepID=UPI003CF2FBCB